MNENGIIKIAIGEPTKYLIRPPSDRPTLPLPAPQQLSKQGTLTVNVVLMCEKKLPGGFEAVDPNLVALRAKVQTMTEESSKKDLARSELARCAMENGRLDEAFAQMEQVDAFWRNDELLFSLTSAFIGTRRLREALKTVSLASSAISYDQLAERLAATFTKEELLAVRPQIPQTLTKELSAVYMKPVIEASTPQIALKLLRGIDTTWRDDLQIFSTALAFIARRELQEALDTVGLASPAIDFERLADEFSEKFSKEELADAQGSIPTPLIQALRSLFEERGLSSPFALT